MKIDVCKTKRKKSLEAANSIRLYAPTADTGASDLRVTLGHLCLSRPALCTKNKSTVF